MTALDDLRRFIDEPTEEVYTNVALTDRIAVASSLEALARDIWLEKAARYSRLVDMQEGSSSRKLSQLGDKALAMAGRFGALVSEDLPASSARPTRVRDIERI